jgi:Flp pilus assembly protein CpaB
VSRRTRALVFLVAALVCAALAATVAGRYRSRVEARYGPLRPVVVATSELAAGQPIGVEKAGAALAVRRVPASFVPPGVLVRPADALGRAPGATIPAGSYVLGAQLAVPRPDAPRAPGVGEGLRPVEVAVAGAQALTVGDGSPEGSRVDVVVARQAGLGRSARARIAASGVRLLALQSPAGPGEGWSATLAVTEQQALALIGAQSAGREIRLLPRA